MGFLFSKPPSSPSKTSTASPPAKGRGPTKAEEAELEVRRARDRMRKAAKRADEEAAMLRERAKEMLTSGRRDDAQRLMRVRKLKLQSVTNANNGLLRLEEVLAGIETAQQAQEVIDGIRRGTEVLNAINEQMPVDKVEELLADSADAIAYQRQVDEALTRGMTSDLEHAVDDELRSMMADMAGESEARVPAAPEPLPAVPTHEPLPSVPSATAARGPRSSSPATAASASASSRRAVAAE